MRPSLAALTLGVALSGLVLAVPTPTLAAGAPHHGGHPYGSPTGACTALNGAPAPCHPATKAKRPAPPHAPSRPRTTTPRRTK